MKLNITRTITDTLRFCLRHVVAFFLLGLLINLPTYLHGLLVRGALIGPVGPRPWWEETVALTGIEALLIGFVMAVMTLTLLHDRRGEDWSALAGLRGSFGRLPTVCGTALFFVIATEGGFALAEFIARFSSWVSFAAIAAVVYLAVALCVAVPVATLDRGDVIGGISYSVERSGDLTKGARWRVVMVFLLSASPLFAVASAAAFAVEMDLTVPDIAPLWKLLTSAVSNAFFFALPVVVHEALVALKEGRHARNTAKVFD